MFYRLKTDYMLRGWEKMTGVLVKRPENEIRLLSNHAFQVLLLCDGQTDLTDDMLDEELKKALKRCIDAELIEECTAAQPLDPEQYYRYYDNRYVHSVFWSVTGRCNFRCRHCFMDAPDGELGELSTEEALSLIDQMAECGVLRVDITGGEPLVRKDFWQLIDRILSYKMVVGTIYTNGWLLSEAVLDEFERRGMKPEISVSFDGVGWHDWMRGVQGAEEATLRALRLCRERGFCTDVEMCIHRGNQDTLPQTIEALREVGVSRLKVSNVSETELWKRHSEGKALTAREYTEAMIRYIPEYFAAGQPMGLTLSGVIVLKTNREYHIVAEAYDGTETCLDCHMCSSARMSCYITPEGRLLPCMPMTASEEQKRFPRVQEIGLKRGLSDSIYLEFVDRRVKDLFAANSECRDCPYRLRCGGGCRATALLEGSHSLMGCDQIMCMLWKEGYVDQIRQAAEEAIARYGGKQEGNCFTKQNVGK